MSNHILLDEYKAYKNLLSNTLDEDKQLNLILYGVTNFLENNYGIILNQKSIEDEFFIQNQNQNKIFINKDVSVINKLYEDNVEQTDLSIYKAKDGILYKLSGVFPYNKYVKINYTVGYKDVVSIPDGIKLAIFLFVDKLYEDIKNNANLINSFTDPVGGREVFKRNIPKEINMLLAPYYYINI